MKKITVGVLEANCYILASKRGTEGVIIDPGDEADTILSVCNEEDIKSVYIICTHGHPDHVGAAFKLAKLTKATLAIHKDDEELLFLPVEDFFLGGLPSSKSYNESDVSILNLKDGEVLKVDELELKIFCTPGHTQGSLSILVDDLLFTGDLLFAGSVGRTDLAGGNYQKLLTSLKNKVAILPDSIKIYPGHGPETTLLEEKKINPFLKEAMS